MTWTAWTHEEAVELCKLVEEICPQYGCHVALTGGCLYKDGLRKDLDLVFYRIRQVPKIDVGGLFGALRQVGIMFLESGERFVLKAMIADGRKIDCLFPELPGDYTVVACDERAVAAVRALERVVV